LCLWTEECPSFIQNVVAADCDVSDWAIIFKSFLQQNIYIYIYITLFASVCIGIEVKFLG
jgi:hypothetical protein